MQFYDFEVFKYDWLVVVIDPFEDSKTVIHNDRDALQKLYESHPDDIWVGFNNNNYDQYIFKGILLGLDPKDINDRIIKYGQNGWAISDGFRKIRMINYDVQANLPMADRWTGLKNIEGFMGFDIKETDVDFNIDRRLTDQELRLTKKYCTHDVEQTIKVFEARLEDFESMSGIIEAYPDMVSIADIGSTAARITAKVLGCYKHDWNDEFEFEIEPCLRIKKYAEVVEWFKEQQEDILGKLQACDELEKSGQGTPPDRQVIAKDFYKRSKRIDVAGVPHVFGFGGLHGAPKVAVHYGPEDGAGYHVDVNNYYPSYLIAHNRVTRSATNDNYAKIYQTRKALKVKQLEAAEAGDKDLAKEYKRQQLPYKKMLNALSGAMKDRTNPAYDPKMNNTMCINGQLMLLDLIEHLEDIDGFRLVQSNTDGLIIWLPDTDEAFEQMDDICYEWETRCSTHRCEIGLALDVIREIYQKDVNNYLWLTPDGDVETCGDYVKTTSAIDNDLPIVRRAVREYLAHKTPIEETIGQCNDLIEFQKIVKLNKGRGYDHVEWEHGEYSMVRETFNIRSKIEYIYTASNEIFDYKCFRVFASTDTRDGRILKCRGNGVKEKFANTPDHCFIYNDNLWHDTATAAKKRESLMNKLDRKYYEELVRKRLEEFGVARHLQNLS